MTETVFKDNEDENRFELHVGEHIVFASYRLDGSTLSITYVEAPPALRGTGAAGMLMQAVMDEARKRGFKVVPICSYAVSWIHRHDEFHDLLA